MCVVVSRFCSVLCSCLPVVLSDFCSFSACFGGTSKGSLFTLGTISYFTDHKCYTGFDKKIHNELYNNHNVPLGLGTVFQ